LWFENIADFTLGKIKKLPKFKNAFVNKFNHKMGLFYLEVSQFKNQSLERQLIMLVRDKNV